MIYYLPTQNYIFHSIYNILFPYYKKGDFSPLLFAGRAVIIRPSLYMQSHKLFHLHRFYKDYYRTKPNKTFQYLF